MMILSGDAPRGWLLRALLIGVVAALAMAPFLFPGAKPLNVAEKICVMALLAASYDLLLGYAGIVSFAHVMFFGIGSYGVALALYGIGPGWGALALGAAGALVFAVALALAIGLFSLRVQSIFFAMVTLAVAYAFNVLASQLSDVTGGEDGRSFQVPPMPPGASHMIWTALPLGSTLFNLPALKKPTDRLSGDQNGYIAPSVPVNCCAVPAAKDRIHNAVPPSSAAATNASRWPSGEIEKL